MSPKPKPEPRDYHERVRRRMEIFDGLPAVVRHAVNAAPEVWIVESLPAGVRKYGAEELARMILANEGSAAWDDVKNG